MHWSWNSGKAKSNLKKHGVSFDEAETVLRNAGTLVFYDGENSSTNEDRFRSIGMSIKLNVLVVVHCERAGNENRIISARRANKSEVKRWQERS